MKKEIKTFRYEYYNRPKQRPVIARYTDEFVHFIGPDGRVVSSARNKHTEIGKAYECALDKLSKI